MHSPARVAVVLVVVAVLSTHALVTGRPLSPSLQHLGPRSVRLLGSLGIAVVLLACAAFLDPADERVWTTIGLSGLLAFAAYQLVTGRGRDKWGRVSRPAWARFWGACGVVIALVGLARLWAWWP
jgi:hypothetical protein